MNVAVMKTKAEQAFAEAFEAAAPKLPGSGSVRDARAAAIGVFTALGLPSRRVEEWKYTDLRANLKEVLPPAVADETPVTIADVIVALGPLARIDAHRVTFVNGRHRPELSDVDAAEGFEVASLAGVLAEATAKSVETLVRPGKQNDDVTVALNTALMTDGAVVRVRDRAAVAKPLLLAFVKAGPIANLATVRNVVTVGKRASVTIIEAHITVPGASRETQVNALTELSAGEGAAVWHTKVLLDGGHGVHLGNWNLALAKDTEYRGFQYSSGVGLGRNQIDAVYGGEGGKLDLSGVYFARGHEHIDTTLTVDHAVPHCESRELFKGVLDGHSRGVFQGKIIVRPNAQKTDGKQMAQALMLSADTEFDSKPELEIYADDVVCGHGTTTAELDEDLLFYCMSRGIPESEARALLIESFVGEALDKVAHEGLKSALNELATDWLRARG